jgi:hypothetical protein
VGGKPRLVEELQYPGQGLGAVLDHELPVDVLQVRLDGERADVEARCYIPVGLAPGYAEQDLRLPPGEPERPEFVPARADPSVRAITTALAWACIRCGRSRSSRRRSRSEKSLPLRPSARAITEWGGFGQLGEAGGGRLPHPDVLRGPEVQLVVGCELRRDEARYRSEDVSLEGLGISLGVQLAQIGERSLEVLLSQPLYWPTPGVSDGPNILQTEYALQGCLI